MNTLAIDRCDEVVANIGTANHTILALGIAKWRGSDGRALAQALRRLGHNVIELDEEDYVPWRWQGVAPKILRRLSGKILTDDYNKCVLRQLESSMCDFVLVFKGNLLKPETVQRLTHSGKAVFNFYPDVSFADHGPNIPSALKYYDCVFTTKSYHGQREIARYRIKRLEYVRHGFDPEVHRPVIVSSSLLARYGCDVSFVGCWSPKKENMIFQLLREIQGLDLKVFGSGWNYSSAEFRAKIGKNLRPPVYGDELAIVYGASKINLGLLSCSVSEPEVCDQTTARTFQIPATRSFMLHEDTREIRDLFCADKEVLLFACPSDMVAKVRLALANDQLREEIRTNAYERCLRENYDYSYAAKTIMSTLAEIRSERFPSERT